MTKSNVFRLRSCCLLVYLLGAPPVFGQSVQFVPGSTTPRIQLTGEHFQIYSNGRYFTDLTHAQTMSRFGVLGTDLGLPVTYQDKILLLFGDTVGAYQSGGKYFQSRTGPNSAGDSIGYIPNVDPSQCRYIGDVDAQLAQGVATPTVSAAGCPSVRFYTNPSRASDEHVFKPIVISGLLPDESHGTFRVPSGGFMHNDRLYMFFSTVLQDDAAGAYRLKSVVARSDQSPGSWSDANPFTFTRLYTVSSHDPVVDPAALPAEAGDVGKFMFSPPLVMDATTLAGAGVTPGLPAALQAAQNVVFVFGGSYRAPSSNMYLAAFSLADADAGPSKWFYYRGNSQWSNDERDAAPLLATSNLANHSVVWNSVLRRFVLMRNVPGAVQTQFSTTPWGPWTDPVTVFSRNDAWGTKLLHHPGQDDIVQSLIPIHDRNGNPIALPDSEVGVPYSPNLLDRFTQNPDGSVTLYYTLSTWNPYQVFLMSSTFTLGTLPTMALDRTSLKFSGVSNGLSFVSQTGSQTVRLTQTNEGPVTWTATSNQPWLTVTPASGSGSATLAVTVQFAALPTVAVSGGITIALTGSANSVDPINVTLTFIQNGTSRPPFGVIDTPVNNATGVTGAVPFTGWGLDDVEVASVAICRTAFGAEVAPIDPRCGGAAQIFVGTPVFIDGARPDVQQAYPALPRSSRAGWGLMVLTNMLPAQGNGTYVFVMYLTDRDSHTVLLGTRTITCSNASSLTPFGTIDTPAQGEVVSGTAYVNFGWALTPQPKSIPVNGSTISVVVDGASVGSVTYDNFRSDIATLFPGLSNTNGAVGFRTIDTTALANGIHTIAWGLTDSAGVPTGIGSRYFTVSNGAGLFTGPEVAAALGTGTSVAAVLSGQVNGASLDASAIRGRRGWTLDAPLRWYRADWDGRVTVQSEEMDRLELQVYADARSITPDVYVRPAGVGEAQQYSGYVRAGNELMPLPIGSTFGLSTGLFTWQPGVGFVGRYDFVFVGWSNGRAVTRREMRVVLNPKGSGRVGPQVVIDTPAVRLTPGTTGITQPFVLAGWAIDADADAGTGVDTLHVWAYHVPRATVPRATCGGATCPDPIFLGATAYGGRRPDVAAIFGDPFRDSGYGITIDSLPPGTYDLAVFAWSTATRGFVPAKVVRVTVR